MGTTLADATGRARETIGNVAGCRSGRADPLHSSDRGEASSSYPCGHAPRESVNACWRLEHRNGTQTCLHALVRALLDAAGMKTSLVVGVLLFSACATERTFPLEIEGYATSPTLRMEAGVSFNDRDESPVTRVRVDVWRADSGEGDAPREVLADAVVHVRPPGSEPVSAGWTDDPEGGFYTATLDGWVDAIAIDVRHREDAVVIEHARALSDPDEISFDVPATLTMKTAHDLYWTGDGRPVNAMVIVYGASVGFTHLGSALNVDSGEYHLRDSVFPFEGEYLVGLTRLVEYPSLPGESLFDAHGSITFSSVSNRQVRVVPPPFE